MLKVKDKMISEEDKSQVYAYLCQYCGWELESNKKLENIRCERCNKRMVKVGTHHQRRVIIK